MKRLENKIIVVTGGSGLLGSAFVRKVAEEGGVPVILDKKIEDKDVHSISCDITSQDSIKNCIDQILDAYGRIDGWINNAYPRTGDWGKALFENESMDSFSQNLEWHLGGYVKCCQQALNVMKTLRYGSLINLSSIYGIVGPDFTIYENTPIINPSAYAAIKGGLVNMTRYLAAYYGPYGVRVNCISPGGIFDNQPSIFVENYEKKVPLKRMGKPEDISPSACFLLSDDAAYITGHNLVIDGGWTVV